MIPFNQIETTMKKKRVKNTKLQIRIEDTLVDRLKSVTHNQGEAMSQFIRQAISEKLQSLTL